MGCGNHDDVRQAIMWLCDGAPTGLNEHFPLKSRPFPHNTTGTIPSGMLKRHAFQQIVALLGIHETATSSHETGPIVSQFTGRLQAVSSQDRTGSLQRPACRQQARDSQQIQPRYPHFSGAASAAGAVSAGELAAVATFCARYASSSLATSTISFCTRRKRPQTTVHSDCYDAWLSVFPAKSNQNRINTMLTSFILLKV